MAPCNSFFVVCKQISHFLGAKLDCGNNFYQDLKIFASLLPLGDAISGLTMLNSELKLNMLLTKITQSKGILHSHEAIG